MNNREIKFRAWFGKKMIPSDTATFFVEFDGTVWENIGSCESDYLQEQHPSECILMQFTGLKDKNNKDIYEGDIIGGEKVLHTGYFNGDEIFEDLVSEVVFENGCFITKDMEMPLFSLSTTDFEVIGNIYENSELIKL